MQIVKECLICGKEFKVDKYRENTAKYCSRECMGKSKLTNKTKKCPICHEEYIYNKKTQIYCSQKCMGKSKQLEEKKCVNCGDYFKPYKSFLKFCSLKCSHNYHTGNKNGMYKGKDKHNCEWCGKEYEDYPSRYKRTRFCSEKCRREWVREFNSGENSYLWKGGNSVDYRGANWHKQRFLAIQRDDFKCVDCGITNSECIEKYKFSLSVHHIKPYRSFKNNYKEANKLDNLTTLCTSCHKIRENLICKYGNIVLSLEETP